MPSLYDGVLDDTVSIILYGQFFIMPDNDNVRLRIF